MTRRPSRPVLGGGGSREGTSLPDYQSEWAIDISFRTPEQLRRLYPRLLQHAITTFGSTDVMRFLGRHMPLNGVVPKSFTG